MTYLEMIFAALQTVILGITAWIVYRYTNYTRELLAQARRQTDELKETNLFNTLLKIRAIVDKYTPPKIQNFYQQEFEKDFLVPALEQISKDLVVKDIQVTVIDSSNIKRTLRTARVNLEMLPKLQINFAQNITYPSRFAQRLEEVEGILTDLDMLGLSIFLKVESAFFVLETYRPFFERTARSLLIFVFLRRQMMNDANYKCFYVYLLNRLGIDTKKLYNIDDPPISYTLREI